MHSLPSRANLLSSYPLRTLRTPTNGSTFVIDRDSPRWKKILSSVALLLNENSRYSNVFFSSNRKETCCGSFSLTQNKNKINFPFRLQQARSSLNNEIVYLISINFPSTLDSFFQFVSSSRLRVSNSREELIVLIVPAPSSNSFEYRILAQTRERKRDVSNVYATFEPRFPRNLASNRSQLDLISEVYSKVSRIRFRMERDFDEINMFTRRLWRNVNSTRIFQELILHDGN